MSASHAPRLSQLVCAATLDLIEAEKTALKVKFIAMSVALVAEAKCMPDNREDLWEEKGEVLLLVEHGRELDIDTKIDAIDRPVVVEVDEAYEQCVAEEIVQLKVDEDVQMEETSQGIEGQGASAALPVAMERMSHVEVPQPVHKRSQQAIAEGEDDGKPKVTIPPGSVLHVVPC
ncbi:hypothetical protein BKA82DRAFT_26491 [Pisolithus tinctorius]|uniref:Uncharacterized protein n=1 Tax=Pisolithus tinctorius Marx 270 TaxID=870435 RepID=A0A0C3P967_PISTI|nr:hypothetical protein BKA82DRAFT_26491 [Pisolithus tinctorius]KIO04286.1 hypothetical protein M404DRAFT_26491 [Pisolithus tinctorius Marx 270]